MTGAGGFLGRHVVAELSRRGHAVGAMMRPSGAAAFDGERVDVVRADLRRPGDELVRALAEVDAVVHTAALSSGSWRAMFSTTVLATENLLEAMQQGGWRGRLVHVSSFSVYGLNQVPRGSVIDERTPLEPQPARRGDYAWTKCLQEQLVRERAATSSIELVVVRPGAIYGRERAFQHRLGRQVTDHGLVLLGGRSLMPLNYVENTASLLAECVEHRRAPGEVFNAVDPDPPTQREYLRWWRTAQPRRVIVAPLPLWGLAACRGVYAAAERITRGAAAAPGFFDGYVTIPVLRSFRYATDKPARVLGWSPPISRQEAVRRTFGSADRS